MRTAPFRAGDLSTASGSTVTRPGGAAGARAQPETRALSVLESRYPGLVRTLTLLWGHPELTEFLSRVAAGLEPRVRDIDPAALAELMLLGAIHRSICPPPATKSIDLHSIGRLAGRWRPAVHRG